MFSGAEAFNQPLNFDTSSVTSMSYMFYGASAFNQTLEWDTSSATSATSMDGMFSGAVSTAASLVSHPSPAPGTAPALLAPPPPHYDDVYDDIPEGVADAY